MYTHIHSTYKFFKQHLPLVHDAWHTITYQQMCMTLWQIQPAPGAEQSLKGLMLEAGNEWPTYLQFSSALTMCLWRVEWTARFVAQEVRGSLQPISEHPTPVQSPLPEQLLNPDYEDTSPNPVGPLPARSSVSLNLTAFRIFFWSRSWGFLYLALESVMSFKIFS